MALLQRAAAAAGGRQLLPFFNILPRLVTSRAHFHDSTNKLDNKSVQQQPAVLRPIDLRRHRPLSLFAAACSVSSLAARAADTAVEQSRPPPSAVRSGRPPRSSSRGPKRIHIVDADGSNGNVAAVFALRLRNARDFQRMLATNSGLLCLVPAQQDASTKAWRFSGDGTRCFSDLRENTFYMAMSALRRSNSSNGSYSPNSSCSSSSHLQQLASLRATVNQVRRELTNRALGEEGELTEALLRIFCKEAGFPNMVSKQQLRIIQNEEVDAVLVSVRAIVIGFHCNRLSKKEAAAALKRVGHWSQLAREGSTPHSFLLGKDLYVALSGNLLPNKEIEQVISYCQKHRLMLLLKNGHNFSLDNSLLPHQHIVPLKLPAPRPPLTTRSGGNGGAKIKPHQPRSP